MSVYAVGDRYSTEEFLFDDTTAFRQGDKYDKNTRSIVHTKWKWHPNRVSAYILTRRGPLEGRAEAWTVTVVPFVFCWVGAWVRSLGEMDGTGLGLTVGGRVGRANAAIGAAVGVAVRLPLPPPLLPLPEANMANRLGKFTLPRPVTGSHPNKVIIY